MRSLEQTPAGFDVGQILFALIFSAAFVQQAVSAPDAFQGAVTEGEIELADETASPESGELLAQRENSRVHQTQAMVVSVSHFANQGEVGRRHGGRW